jgi:hypothetical protein
MADQTEHKAQKDRDPAADAETAWHGRDRYPQSSPEAGVLALPPIPPATGPKP